MIERLVDLLEYICYAVIALGVPFFFWIATPTGMH